MIVLLSEHKYRLFCFGFCNFCIGKVCESNKKNYVIIFVITLSSARNVVRMGLDFFISYFSV